MRGEVHGFRHGPKNRTVRRSPFTVHKKGLGWVGQEEVGASELRITAPEYFLARPFPS
jgi:hypothetical protein